MRNLAFVAVAIMVSGSAKAENFSCSFGRGACLDYGDTVCSSLGKCVSNDAVCFDSFACNFKGFVCKSKLDDLADEYDTLVAKYNDLLGTSKKMSTEIDDLLSLQSQTRSCLSAATSLQEAQACSF